MTWHERENSYQIRVEKANNLFLLILQRAGCHLQWCWENQIQEAGGVVVYQRRSIQIAAFFSVDAQTNQNFLWTSHHTWTKMPCCCWTIPLKKSGAISSFFYHSLQTVICLKAFKWTLKPSWFLSWWSIKKKKKKNFKLWFYSLDCFCNIHFVYKQTCLNNISFK